MATTTITTAAGQVVTLPYEQTDQPVLGLDAEGRVVLDMGDYGFGLTLCCQAWDKGLADDTCCRACYGPDTSAYYFWGEAKGVTDPAVSVVLA